MALMMVPIGPIDMNSSIEIQKREPEPIDFFEAEMAAVGGDASSRCRHEHYFTEGLYTRKIFMPAGSYVVSMRHKFEHPFHILEGLVAVIRALPNKQFEREGLFKAGYTGITKAGTKRILHVIENTVWVTTHLNPDNIQDPDEMIEFITEKNSNPLLLDTESDSCNQWRTHIHEHEIMYRHALIQ